MADHFLEFAGDWPLGAELFGDPGRGWRANL